MYHVKRKSLHCFRCIMLHVQLLDNNKMNNKAVGALGERLAANYLKTKGFSIVQCNYLKKWGEIDIVARENGKIHFIEVKSVSYETKEKLKSYVSRGTWQPEDNVHPYKIKKLARAIESWIAENNYTGDWQIDVVAIRLVPCEKYATVKYINNIII